MSVLSLLLTPEEQERLQHASQAEFHAELYRAWNLKANLAAAATARQAAAADRLAIAHHEALGQQELVVQPFHAAVMRARHGRECFDDPQFRRDFARDNPACAIRSRSTAVTIVHPGLGADRREQGEMGKGNFNG